MGELSESRMAEAPSANTWRQPKNGAEKMSLAAPPLAHFDGSDGLDGIDASAVLQHATAAPYLLPTDERVDLFRAQILSHRILKLARTAVMSAIQDPGDARLVLLFGPTRVGKSTLLDYIVWRFEEARQRGLHEGTWNPGHIPILRIALRARGERPVSFIDIYKQLLRAADEPLIEHKRAPTDAQAWKPRIYERRQSEADLSWAVELMLRHRRPAAVLIDEAQHLALRRSPEAVRAQLESLKSLADATNTVYVLAGSYELLAYRNRNSQLSARSLHLHFPRYQLKQAGDSDQFQHAVSRFGECLPLEQPPDLARHWEYLYRYSGGMVGALKTWLARALKRAAETGAATLTLQHLEATEYEHAQIQTMIAQAVDGEIALRKEANKLGEINRLLGFDSSVAASVGAGASSQSTQQVGSLAPEAGEALPTGAASANAGDQKTTEEESPARATSGSKGAPTSVTGKQRKRRVGERKPGRDRTGPTAYDPSAPPFRI